MMLLVWLTTIWQTQAPNNKAIEHAAVAPTLSKIISLTETHFDFNYHGTSGLEAALTHFSPNYINPMFMLRNLPNGNYTSHYVTGKRNLNARFDIQASNLGKTRQKQVAFMEWTQRFLSFSPYYNTLILNFNHPPCRAYPFFVFSQKRSHYKLLILWRSIRIQNSMVLRWLVQVLHPPQNFEHPPFWNGCSYGIKVTAPRWNSMVWPPYWISLKIYQFVQKLMGGIDTQTG
jgi:hypothetical protein